MAARRAALRFALVALAISSSACDVERDLDRSRFTCSAGGYCDGEDPDGGVVVPRDASTSPPDSGFPINLDGLIPDVFICPPFC